MPNVETSGQQDRSNPDYVELVKFLLQPLLDDAESLSLDCESSNAGQNFWLRVAFEKETDKGKIFGRGGKNIQAIRTVINTAATAVGQSVCLEVFSDRTSTHRSQSSSGRQHRPSRNANGSNGDGSRNKTRKKSLPRPNLDPS